MKSQVMMAGVLVAGLAGLAGGATSSAEGIVPFDVQVPLVLKALTYDRNLKARAGDHVRIGVVSPAKASREPADDLLSSVSHLPDRTVSGLPVSFMEISAADEGALDQALRGSRWAAVYVMPGFRPDDLAQIRRLCAARQVLAVAAEVQDVERGIAFGVGSAAGRPQIVVNVASAKASGTDFDLALLRLARLVQ